jgi:hypothetical protein
VHRRRPEVEHALGRDRVHGARERVMVAQVGHDGRVRTRQVGEPSFVGVGPDERVHLVAPRDLVAHHVRSYEPGGTGDQDARHAKYR